MLAQAGSQSVSIARGWAGEGAGDYRANTMIEKRDLEQRAALRERRLNMRLMAFWWDRRGDRRFPSLEDFDPEALADIWPHCFSLVAHDPPQKSVFRFIGDAVAETLSGVEGKITIDGLTKDSLLDHATRNIDEVLEQRVPAVTSGEYFDPAGNAIVYRSILLPFSSDQETIDSVVGGARCKVKRAV